MTKLTDEDFENLAPGNRRRWISPGLYPARFVDRSLDKRRADWGEKLVFSWEAYLEPSMKQSVVLQRNYNVYRGPGNRFVFGHGHALRSDWVRASSGKVPLDERSLPLDVFRKGLFWLEIVTVLRDDKRRPLHPSLHYSRVGMVIRPFSDADISFERYPVQLAEIDDIYS
jgi:hypothetical protein